MEEKKLGRPVTGTARNIKFTVRLNEDEYNKLKQIADKENLTSAEFVRKLIQNEISK